MKKLLRLIGTFVLIPSAVNPMMACANSEPTYYDVKNAINSLNLVSYAKQGDTTNIQTIIDNIENDASIALAIKNYGPDVVFDKTKLTLLANNVTIPETSAPLTVDNLKDDDILSLTVIFNYKSVETVTTTVNVASSILNVTTKSERDIVNYINNYNFSKFTPKLLLIPVGKTVPEFTEIIQKWLVSSDALGSFSTFITEPFTIDSTKKGNGNDALSQEDLNKPGTLGITINYKYGAIKKEQSITLNITISE